jgi:ketosteroid isomerase-like protein
MSVRDAVLFANEAFYRAFADRDMRAMDAAWSSRLDVACLHPGWQPLFGRAAVLESWAAILGNPQSPKIRARDAKVQMHGEIAVVVCYEEIDGQFLVASNVFVHEGQIWKMVLHQGGATAGAPSPEETADDPPRVN